MNILVHGCTGRMGQTVLSMLAGPNSPHTLAAGVSPEIVPGTPGQYLTLDEYTGPADVVVDFSNHAATGALLDYCEKRKLPVVLCTTGQTPGELARIQQAAKSIPVFRSANMSLGVAVLIDLARRAARMFPDADIEIVEAHHNQKMDVPSGTALMLANAIREVRPEASFVVGRHENGKRQKGEIGIHSLRLGSEVGMHEIFITTGNETLTLRHEASSRALFAEGALAAAAWLGGKTAGLYGMPDLLEEQL
jgi:4-hydroxy-tetrahydrodipicolinate reductase